MPPAPAELERFVERLGAEDTLRLLEAYGGNQIYLPKCLSESSRLAVDLGLDVARKMIAWRESGDWLGGERMKIPACKSWRVLVYQGRGMSYREIARKLQIDEATVARHIAAGRRSNRTPRTDTRQTAIF